MKSIIFDRQQKIGVTSDTHVGHGNILQYCMRPWLSKEELSVVRIGQRIKVSPESILAHDDAIIERTNAVLGSDDVLIHCGDVAWKSKVDGKSTLGNYRDRLTVKNIYVATGNHDDYDDLVHVFGRDRVFERFMIRVGEYKSVIDHYPGHSWLESHHGAFLLYGHVHGNLWDRHLTNPAWLLSLDVGVDTHGFNPWIWDKDIIPLFASRRVQWQEWRDRTYSKKEGGGMAPKLGEKDNGGMVRQK